MTFRTERLAEVVVCVDARPASYRAADATEPHAVALAVDAAGRIGDALFDANHQVGLAGFGRHVCVLPTRTVPITPAGSTVGWRRIRPSGWIRRKRHARPIVRAEQLCPYPSLGTDRTAVG